VVAHTTLTIVEHWFGGRRVPCQHVSGVAVPPAAKIHALFSLLLWAGVITCGRLLAYL
jgi:hypothetical protein